MHNRNYDDEETDAAMDWSALIAEGSLGPGLRCCLRLNGAQSCAASYETMPIVRRVN